MPLGRFAAYFCALILACLIAFPRAIGSPLLDNGMGDDPAFSLENGSAASPAESGSLSVPQTWRPEGLPAGAEISPLELSLRRRGRDIPWTAGDYPPRQVMTARNSAAYPSSASRSPE